MTALVFMDTETTGLALTDDIWEFAGIRREEDGIDRALHLFIKHDKGKCANLPESFREDHEARYNAEIEVSTYTAAVRICSFMGDRAHIVGAVPNFDTERLAMLLRSHGIEPDWHYHIIDAETLAVGYLAGLSAADAGAGIKVSLPWSSDELSVRIGVEVPVKTRHTAMGDALWAMAIYDKIME